MGNKSTLPDNFKFFENILCITVNSASVQTEIDNDMFLMGDPDLLLFALVAYMHRHEDLYKLFCNAILVYENTRFENPIE